MCMASTVLPPDKPENTIKEKMKANIVTHFAAAASSSIYICIKLFWHFPSRHRKMEDICEFKFHCGSSPVICRENTLLLFTASSFSQSLFWTMKWVYLYLMVILMKISPHGCASWAWWKNTAAKHCRSNKPENKRYKLRLGLFCALCGYHRL